MNPKVIVILGPTASGKTGIGVQLAKKFNGEIISADSRQVYRGLDLGTGKDLKEYDSVRYHLIDICDPEEKFNMFDWLESARLAVRDILDRGMMPIVVGGTGLYIQALVEGFTTIKNEKLKIRNSNLKSKKYSREELDLKTSKDLQKILGKLDLESFNKIDQNNPHRLIRAIERVQEGIEISKIAVPYDFLQIGINLPREKLYKRIDKRVGSRFEEGMLEEVRGLLDSGINPKWLHKLGLEYRIISEYLLSNSKIPVLSSKSISNVKTDEFQEMSQLLKYRIHAFARRQLTWFRRFSQIRWISNYDEVEKVAENFLYKK